ncbi:hypothetical protein [Klebsiella michiganensis]|uniref:hypothetical protein n=1 Tax=Klebsiella michiganensis TaxID=1134687 RepID=UPI0013C4C3FA|nr:hypothetical protein [Klebsiella michiganensis]
MNHCLTVFVISLFLTGCGNHLVFEPNKLPNGYIDQEYYVPITISGGTGPVVDLSYEIRPSNSGLKLVFAEKKYYTKYIYNNFTIEGKPKLQGIVTIIFRGGLLLVRGNILKNNMRLMFKNKPIIKA